MVNPSSTFTDSFTDGYGQGLSIRVAAKFFMGKLKWKVAREAIGVSLGCLI